MDIQVGEKDRKRRIVDEYGLDPDKTIVYRPRRTKDPEIDLPLILMRTMIPADDHLTV